MVGSGLKKLAKEYGMKISCGVAYGAMNGYAATFSEGANYKQVVFTVWFENQRKMEELAEFVNRMNVQRRYRVQMVNITRRGVQVIFKDYPGTMKKIQEFLVWFLPLLESHGACGVNICTECGGEMTSGRWVLVEGTAYYLHDSCAEHIRHEVDIENTQRKEEMTGSYLLGTIGAMIGSMLGAVIWALVLNMGYVASLIGLLIGWLAEKGYNLLHGKQGKAKVVILILAVIFGVLFGTVLADVITLGSMILSGELPDFVFTDIPQLIIFLLGEDPEYLAGTVSNILTGFLFAALGVFALLRKTGKEVADTKFVDLKN